MAEHVVKLPDVGEGVAEAELVEWHVKPGDLVREDAVLAAVMTDKATVEIPSPVDGEISWLGAEIGDIVAVGSPLIRLNTKGGDDVTDVDVGTKQKHDPTPAKTEIGEANPEPKPKYASVEAPSTSGATVTASFGAPRKEGEKPLASPAVRQRAKEAGVDLRQ